MNDIKFENIPAALRELNQWVLWSIVERDGKPTKIPYQPHGVPAKSNEPDTWHEFGLIRKVYAKGGYDGIGFVFTADDPLCGIDLDGCRDPQTGKVADWAREVLLKLNTYAEVSPSLTGVKAFVLGTIPFDGGKKTSVKDVPSMGDKAPAIEVYDSLRYFAVTGLRVKGPTEPQERQAELEWIKAKFWPDEPVIVTPRADWHSNDAIVERARKYLAKLPAAVSGSGGHNATFHAACVLVLGFELSESDALNLMHEFNARCNPPWSERDLERKVREAAKQTGKRGYLKNAAPANWQRIPVPQYTDPLPAGPRITTLAEATQSYIDRIRQGVIRLYTTGIPDLDCALGGGIERGEYFIIAGLPSHGKSMVALQMIHAMTGEGIPCAFISEEMSSLMLGKRTLQFITPIHQEHWRMGIATLENEVAEFNRDRAPCYVIENCGTINLALEAMAESVAKGAQCIAVDYAQLIRSPGKTRYEQTTNTSVMLRQFASANNVIIIALCQLNRASEDRPGAFVPQLSDIKESGQFGQDADVVCGICWPYRMNADEPRERYQIFPLKNRNRDLQADVVECRINAARQQVLDPLPESRTEKADGGIRF